MLTFEEIDSIPFYDNYGRQLDNKICERVEQEHGYKYIEQEDCILELGGRFGMASCFANARLSNKKNHVVVEPDSTVIEALHKNKESHFADFHVFNGFVSKTTLTLLRDEQPLAIGFGNFSVQSESSDSVHKTLEELELEYGLTFNTLIADCEGFLETFFQENFERLLQFKKILFEKDNPHMCNYSKIQSLLEDNNFKQFESTILHEVWFRNH
jgi:hypothetical protein